jgi:hypothetical protein
LICGFGWVASREGRIKGENRAASSGNEKLKTEKWLAGGRVTGTFSLTTKGDFSTRCDEHPSNFITQLY